MNWGKEQGIIFGPGRGSAAGSIISYALKITELDPLKYDLLFERFLNPDRISMPDVDIDIQDTRRDEVIQYCADKYGQDRVANIVTFGTMAARNAVRDVARVLQVPYAEADRWAKMIPAPVQGRHIPLEKYRCKRIRTSRKNTRPTETANEVFDLAVRVEGTIRSHGVHACRRRDRAGRHRQIRAAGNGPERRSRHPVSNGPGRRAGAAQDGLSRTVEPDYHQ